MLNVKGNAGGICLCFDECTYDEALAELKKLKGRGDGFFAADGSLEITYSGVRLCHYEEACLNTEIKKLFGKRARLVSQNPLTEAEIAYALNDDERICRVVKGTVRSGDTVNSRGDLLIYGDVNPGAVVAARGNITVLGALRGTARTTRGTIYARYMNPVQIQIGNTISYNKSSENVGSALAKAKKGEIIVECF